MVLYLFRFFLFGMLVCICLFFFFFFQAEDGIRDVAVTGVQTCALPISVKLQTGLERQACESLVDVATRVVSEGQPFVEIEWDIPQLRHRPWAAPPPRYRCRPDEQPYE